MDGFDFNIQNYSLAEMEDFMGLAPKKKLYAGRRRTLQTATHRKTGVFGNTG